MAGGEKRPVVVHLFRDLVLGGAVRDVFDLINHLAVHGFCRRLYVLSEHGCFPYRSLVQRNIINLSHIFTVMFPSNTLKSARSLKLLLLRLKGQKPSIDTANK